MDYDDNDFQSQNQQLAGEGSTKFSPVLQPYALSKFDFEDNLQGHLRFDSLVESEVFLGIGNNVDSQWIEDFSRGNSAIEFTTCASESCSLSRHNNVWSEATSSESVEMLLKSVGLEETMPRQPAVKLSNASDPGSSTTQMDPNLTQDVGVIADKVDATKDKSVSPLTEILPSSTVENAVEEHLAFEEVALETLNGPSPEGNSVKEDPIAHSGNSGSPTAGVHLFADEKDIGVAHGEVSEKDLHLSDSQNRRVNAGSSLENVEMNHDGTEKLLVLDQASTIDNVCHTKTQSGIESGEPLSLTSETCRNKEFMENTAARDVHIPSDSVICDHSKEDDMEEMNDLGINAVPALPDVFPKVNPEIQSVEELGDGTLATSDSQATEVENANLHQDAKVGELSEVERRRSFPEDLVETETGVRNSITKQPMDSSEQKLLVAVEISTENTNALEEGPLLMEVKLAAASAVAVLPVIDCVAPENDNDERRVAPGSKGVCSLRQLQEEVQRNDALDDTSREQVATENCISPAGPVKDTLGHSEIKQGHASLAMRDDRQGGIANPEVSIKSDQAALESSSRDYVSHEETEPSSDQVSGSVVPSELPSHQAARELDHEPHFNSTHMVDGADRENHQVSEIMEAATLSHQSVDIGKESLEKSVLMERKGDDVAPTPGKQGMVSLKGDSSRDSESISKSPAISANDHSDSSKANCSSPIVISSMSVSQNEIVEEQTEKVIDQKLSPSEGKDVLDLRNARETESSKDDRSFTFDVRSLEKRDLTMNWQPFPSAQDSKVDPSAEGSPTPALVQVENQAPMLNNVGNPLKPAGETSRGRKKDSSERKPRRASGKSAGKESGKKGSSGKVADASKQTETVEKLSHHPFSPQGAHKLLQSGEVQHHGQVDFTNAKSFGVLTTATSGLPDLNSSVYANMVFRQPFTDLQQVQLRAQIFVYGSLISKLVPEEAHMMSAFGGPDGGRSMWENAWRVCRERVVAQASLPAIIETPVKSRSGEVIFDQAGNQGTRQAVVSSSPAIRANNKGTASPAISPMQPLTSPVWSIPTPSFEALQIGSLPKGPVQPAFSTFHLNQSPPASNYFGPSSSWMSQAPFRSPWSASPQTSMPNPSTRLPPLPMTEAFKLLPALESPVPVSSGMESVPSVPVGKDGSLPTILPCGSATVDPKNAMLLPCHSSADSKSRKRKKVSASGNLGQISSHQSLLQLNPIPSSIGLNSTTVAAASSSGLLSETQIERQHVLRSPSSSVGDPRLRELDKNKSVLSEESIVKVQEARKQAEDAAALSSAAVNHCEDIWDLLNKHKNSGQIVTVEVKLASAAAAIAAAASVAKAAAAAASVASKAALQAKLMADEAINLSRRNGHSSNEANSTSVGGKDASSSILWGDTATNISNSAIFAAREAARRRIEAASAASLQAENLDAVVKAAELAAEAIAKAGKVVTMGDPLPLTDLVEAGPDGFWKLPSAELCVTNMGNAVLTANDSSQQSAGLKHGKGTIVNSIDGTLVNSVRGKKGNKVSYLGNGEGNLLAELQFRSGDAAQDDLNAAIETAEENSIKVGSQVEVFKNEEGNKAAWFSANVLNLKDGKALACYSEIPSDEGSGKLEEWVDLGCAGDEPPKLRIAHPRTVIKFEGTRKRRRAAMGDFTCSVGDKVDAWIKDSWREGVVTEKDKKDGTTVTVHFPAHGDTSVVRAWHLRPSLIWKNGEWVEWSRTVGSMISCPEGDMPQEKRAKLGTPGLAPKGKDKQLKNTLHFVETEKPPREESLNLTSKEKVFNIGKKTVDGKKDSLRTRTGLQKEGSRVVIGVPKPGKKRKFMEVSKHYVGHQTRKADEVNDSVKLASYLMPQGGGPRGWKPFSRTDTREKGVTDSKAKVLRSGRSQNTSGRTNPPKSSLATANSTDGPPRDHPDHDGLQRHDLAEFKSLSESEGAASDVHADAVTSSDAGSSKASMVTARAERVTKGKVPSGKAAKGEENKASNNDSTKPATDGAEPRRSNRRIQPTSRLLEGLQSSMTIAKFPSSLHDRGHKSLSKGAAKGKSNG